MVTGMPSGAAPRLRPRDSRLAPAPPSFTGAVPVEGAAVPFRQRVGRDKPSVLAPMPRRLPRLETLVKVLARHA